MVNSYICLSGCHIYNMEKNIFTIVRIVLFAVMVAALVVFLVMKLQSGVDTAADTLITGLFGILILWGLVRLYVLIKGICRK